MAKYTAQQMIDALTATSGNKSAAATAIGCSRNTIDRYIREYATVGQVYEELTVGSIDDAESVLHQFMRGEIEGQSPREQLDAAKYLLSTIGKSRGYTKRNEVEHSGGVDIDWSSLTDEQVAALARGADPSEVVG